MTAPPQPPPLVSASGLTRDYRRGKASVTALRGVDLEIRPGDTLAVIGPSGGGKSTLLNLLGGLDRPDAGTLEVAGTDLTSASQSALDDFRRHHIGFVFQFFNLLDVANARDNVAYALLARGTPWREARSEAMRLLSDLGLKDRASHRPSELSGGEQQRVAIARAIAGEPDLLIADEPTGDVDGAATGVIMDMLEALNDEHGITIVIATHDPAVATRARRVAEMRDGTLREQ